MEASLSPPKHYESSLNGARRHTHTQATEGICVYVYTNVYFRVIERAGDTTCRLEWKRAHTYSDYMSGHWHPLSSMNSICYNTWNIRGFFFFIPGSLFWQFIWALTHIFMKVAAGNTKEQRGRKGEFGRRSQDGDRQSDECMTDFFLCAKRKHSPGLLTAGSTNRLKKNNTNNIAQGFYCTNIPRALSPQLS